MKQNLFVKLVAALELDPGSSQYRRMVKTLICLWVLIGIGPSAAALAQTPSSKVASTYSSRSIASVDLFITQERGFFREEGLDLRVVQVRATAAIAAIVSGEVRALGSMGSAFRAIPRGAPIKVMAVSPRRPVFWRVTRPALETYRISAARSPTAEFRTTMN